jgi:mannose-6-phosphate isomerase-like protein (cupin superfamily)
MKQFIIIILILFPVVVFSQDIINVSEIKPGVEYDNIHVKKIDTDTNSSTFIIWIKKGVKSHKHEKHSEVIHVIEGSGVMTINNISFDIKVNDYFRIPQNTFHSLRVLSNEPMKVLSIQAPEFLGKDRVFESAIK